MSTLAPVIRAQDASTTVSLNASGAPCRSCTTVATSGWSVSQNGPCVSSGDSAQLDDEDDDESIALFEPELHAAATSDKPNPPMSPNASRRLRSSDITT